MEEKIDDLIIKAEQNDYEALQKVVEYYRNNEDNEMAQYFEDKLKNVQPNAFEKKQEPVTEKATNVSESMLGNNTIGEISKLSNAKLFEKAKTNAIACKVLGDRYFKDSNYSKALSQYKEAMEMFKEKGTLSGVEKGVLSECYAYIAKALVYTNASEGEIMLNLQNSIEIDCATSYKVKAYRTLSDYYEKIGEWDEFEKNNSKYKEGCLLQTKKYQNDNNNIDAEIWLEKAKDMPVSFSENENDDLNRIIRIKEMLAKKKQWDIAELPAYLPGSTYKIDDYLSAKELKKLFNTMSAYCEDAEEEINASNDILFFACWGLVLHTNIKSGCITKEIHSYMKKYCILRNGNLNFVPVNIKDKEDFKSFCRIFGESLLSSGDKDTVNWLKQLAEVSSVDLNEIIALAEKASTIIKEKDDILEQARKDCLDIENKAKQTETGANIEEGRKKYLTITTAICLFFCVSLFIFHKLFFTISVSAWLVCSYIKIDGYIPDFVKETPLYILLDKMGVYGTEKLKITLIDFNSNNIVQRGVYNNMNVRFGKFKKMGYIQNYVTESGDDGQLKWYPYNVQIDNYKTIFKGYIWDNELWVNIDYETILSYKWDKYMMKQDQCKDFCNEDVQKEFADYEANFIKINNAEIHA